MSRERHAPVSTINRQQNNAANHSSYAEGACDYRCGQRVALGSALIARQNIALDVTTVVGP